MAAQGEDVPPPHFQRMLSWELSQVVDYSEITKTKKKKRRKRSEEVEKQQETFDHSIQSFPTSPAEPSHYRVINSDGEEDLYYSAPQTPDVSSSDEELDSIASTSSMSPSSIASRSLEPSDLIIEREYRQNKGSSKRSKKRQKEINRLAQIDFFQPLCDLFEDKLQLHSEGLGLTNYSTVPSLCELCLRKIRTTSKISHSNSDLPYLLLLLINNDRRENSTVNNHIQWIEKLLGDYQLCYKVFNKHMEERSEGSFESHAYGLQKLFECKERAIKSGDIDFNFGLHSPLPRLNYRMKQVFITCYSISTYAAHGQMECLYLRPLLHYTNYLYPLLVSDGKGKHKDQSTAIDTAIQRVNYWINSRYPQFSREYSESLKLWPGYVHWARGNLQLATEAFGRAIKDLNDPIDQAVLLNELGRMFVHFGERGLAVSHYRKSSDVDISKEIPIRYDEQSFEASVATPSNQALQASVWDAGPMDRSSATLSKHAWDSVLKTITDTKDYPTDVWYFHVAAVESQLFVHAGQMVQSRTPDQQDDSPASSCDVIVKWANEIEATICSPNNLDNYSILYYHLSLVYAIKGKPVESKRAFNNYIDSWAGFTDWDTGRTPGYQFYTHLPRGQRPAPWKNLLALLPEEGPGVVPILPLHWRVRLLHPQYPYACINSNSDYSEGSVLSDHTSRNGKVNLRLTRERYLTGDLQMDMPPMKAVYIDPYTGELCFPRRAALQHWNYSQQYKSDDFSTLPWPLRVYESEECVVELLMGHNNDLQYTADQFAKESNYTCLLHWYGSDGTQRKVDLRKLIRKERKRVLLEAIKNRTDVKAPLDEIEKRLDVLFNQGLEMTICELYRVSDNKPAAVDTSKKLTKQLKKDKAQRKRRKNVQFYLFLNSHMVISDSTVRLTFGLDCNNDYTDVHVIVYLDCSTAEGFLSPRVHVAADLREFTLLYPPVKDSDLYPRNHLSHVKTSTVTKVSRQKLNGDKTFTRLVFNDKGDVIYHVVDPNPENQPRGRRRGGLSKTNQDAGDYIIGERGYKLTDHNCVQSWSIFNNQLTHDSCPLPNPQSLQAIPGLLLVTCNDGLVLLHPGTLERLTITGSDDSTVPPAQDGYANPQFHATDAVVAVIAVYDAKTTANCKTAEDLLLLSALSSENEGEGEQLLPDDVNDYGSCKLVLSVCDRLLILECSPRTVKVEVTLDIKLPGKPLEYHPLKGSGFLVTVSQFPDLLRSDLYWISPTGTLLGMLPCLGPHPHSMFSTHLPPKGTQEGGVHVFFDDGMGGVCCLRLRDALNW